MRNRVLTALALIPPVLAAVFCTDIWPIFALCLALICIGSQEINTLIRGKLVAVGALLWVAMGFAAAWVFASGKLDFRNLTLVGLVGLLFGVAAAYRAGIKASSSWATDLLAGGWIAGPMLALVGIHLMTAGPTPPWFKAEMPILMAFVPLWAGDTAAIFGGMAFGKHALAPAISPKKTIEGGIANLLASVLAAWGLGSWLGVPLAQSIACGLAAGILGQVGDLFESWVKRRANLKDSGTLLPGHGGIMDRIDSILFTAPVVALILFFWP